MANKPTAQSTPQGVVKYGRPLITAMVDEIHRNLTVATMALADLASNLEEVDEESCKQGSRALLDFVCRIQEKVEDLQDNLVGADDLSKRSSPKAAGAARGDKQ